MKKPGNKIPKRTPVKFSLGRGKQGKTVVYKRNSSGKLIKSKVLLASESQNIFMEEYQGFALEFENELQPVPDFDYKVYSKYRSTILADKGWLQDPQEKRSVGRVTNYFRYLVELCRDISRSEERVFTYREYCQQEMINHFNLQRQPIPDTIKIAGIEVGIPSVVRDMYDEMVKKELSEKGKYNSQGCAYEIEDIELFMMTKSPRQYVQSIRKPLGDLVVDLYTAIKSAYEPIKVIEAWGLLDDHCLATAVKNIYLAQMDDSVDILPVLENAAWHLNYRIDFMKRKIEKASTGMKREFANANTGKPSL